MIISNKELSLKLPQVMRFIFSKKVEQRYADDEPNNLVRHNAELLKRTASTCRCGGLAPPIKTTGHTYKCILCDKSFDSISYNLGPRLQKGAFNASPKTPSQLLNMDYYNEAVKILKAEHKS